MSLSLQEAKKQADRLSSRLVQLGVRVQRTQALEGVAAIHNFSDWNRFRAHLDGEADSVAEPPVSSTPTFKRWNQPWTPGEVDTVKADVIQSFLFAVGDAGIGIVGLARLEARLRMAEVWQQEFLNAIMEMHRVHAFSIYMLAVFEERSTENLRKLLTEHQFSADAVSAIVGSILRIGYTPAQFIYVLKECGIKIEGERELQVQLEMQGPTWLDGLVSVFRTCRKFGVEMWSPNSNATEKLKSKLAELLWLPDEDIAACAQNLTASAYGRVDPPSL